jgi:5'-nucleotidase
VSVEDAVAYEHAAHCGLSRRSFIGRACRATLLNVNVPAGEISGVQITRMGQRVYHDELVARVDPRGRTYYWIGGGFHTGIPDDGTDVGALHHGYISVTPIQMDMTAYHFMDALKAWSLTKNE